MKLIFINIIFVLYTFCTLFLQTGCYLSDNAASIIGRMKSIRTLNYSECQRIMDWEKSNKHLNPELISVNFSIIKSVDNTGIKEITRNRNQGNKWRHDPRRTIRHTR